jgi:hypothetical protein
VKQAWENDGVSIMVDLDDPDSARRYKMFTFEVPVSPETKQRFPDVSRFAGEWIALRFHVQNGSLYSFWIE